MVRVRGHCVVLMVLFLVGSVYAGADQSADPQYTLPEKFHVPKGTSVKLELTQPVSSETAKVGDRLSLRVLEEVKIGDVLLIPKGSEAAGFVSDVRAQRLWGQGRLEIYVSSVRTRTGFNLPVYGVFRTAGESVSGAGTPAIVSQGTVLVAKTELDIPLDKELFSQPVVTETSKDSAGA